MPSLCLTVAHSGQVAYDDLVSSGNMKSAKEAGLVRSEGKDYVVKEGDVMLFRFNV